MVMWLGAVFTMAAVAAATASAQTKLLRFPDIHGDRVVFSYAGDLWLAATDGGLAARLTAHPGLELFPRFSPDGSRIAFTGQYDGDEQVYVIPASGGVPRQLTYYPARGPLAPRWGYDNQVYDWSPDGRAVLFRSLRYSMGPVVTAGCSWRPPTAGLPSAAADAGVRGGRPVAGRDARRLLPGVPRLPDLEAVRGGLGAGALHLRPRDARGRAGDDAPARRPRPDVDRRHAIYFTSDRDGTLNLYSYDLASRETTQLTDSDTWDVRWPG